MFMEVPVILSNAGYTQRLFTHEKDCLIVPVQNPVALAGALQCLIENRALRTQLTRGARELLRQCKKDRTSIVQEVRTYYDQLQEQRTALSHQV